MSQQLLSELINNYQEMARITACIDFSNRKSIKANNKAVDRMYAIVEQIKMNFGESGIVRFSKLLDISENKTNIWAAAQMLERMKVDISTRKKALKIIKVVSTGNDDEALGFQIWLKNWEDNHAK